MNLSLSTVSIASCLRSSRKKLSQGSKLSAKPTKTNHNQKLCVCKDDQGLNQERILQSRRSTLVLGSSAALLGAFHPLGYLANADEERATYYGAANPPATYGSVGGTTPDKARYIFQYPVGWKEEAISKTEKGTNGTDCRFVSGARKKEQVYVVTLKNEGMASTFKNSGAEKTLESISGADYVFQDAISYGSIKTETRVSGEDTFYDYTIEGANNFLVSATTRQGRLFAIFVNAPLKGFTDDRAMLEGIQKSFRTVEVDVLV
mmetsp:Transcript_15548/g.21472  ORF Transcript_15548/g.21472 Transcript_15548/m.21472 type:complete len:262 (+) Transcript_15548:92-877(+)|eukprot:CAMPEP_0196581840 /NCGR_PEP_ID=MMETSP1081-20130531/35901_1 /TAXON_ID=36882 /ORGANISM="Pyramimonas amylifera, Strain CCMP720" /LENGTH=261 /DNA_ID=CAMNT_0041902217 /DNA_START=86 /DNA_END=871 /DNA_ORIENTATION=+